MTIEAIRFRADEGRVILQVLERKESSYQYERTGEWRDAKVEDLLEVARYTRAHDYLDGVISGLQNTISDLQSQVHCVLDKVPHPEFDNFHG